MPIGKNPRRLCFFVLLGWLALVAPLQAQEPRYLAAGRPDPVALLAPPPLPDSAEQAADLASTISIYKARSAQDEAAAHAEKKFSIFTFAPAVGTFFQSGKLPKTTAFFERVSAETEAVTTVGKEFWKRPRPYVVEPSLGAGGAEMEKSFSYPSGHSTRATVLALLLAELFPEKQEGILAIGRNIGWHRVQTARHYPADIYAGRSLGQAIVRELKANPAFVSAFAEVKAELQAAQRAD